MLTQSDLLSLRHDPSASQRCLTAKRLAETIKHPELSADARHLADTILRHFSLDPEIIVRRAVAQGLANSQYLPHDVACCLALDSSSVALPVILFSQVLNDSDLLALISSPDARVPARQLQQSIASRVSISCAVCNRLIAVGSEVVNITLLRNHNAPLTLPNYVQILKEFPNSPRLIQALGTRASLPEEVRTRVKENSNQNLKTALIQPAEIPFEQLCDLLLQNRGREILGLEERQGDLKDIVARLHASGQLNDSLLLRLLFWGDSDFFLRAVAQRAGGKSEALCQWAQRKEPPHLLDTYLRRAQIREPLIGLLSRAFVIVQQINQEDPSSQPETLNQRIVSRILTQIQGDEEQSIKEDMHYLLERANILGLQDSAADGDAAASEIQESEESEDEHRI